MSFNIEVESGSSVRLTTAGKYCDRDIVVTATGGGGSGSIQYAKFTATPTSTTSFVIENPLGGIVKKVSVCRISTAVSSTRKIRKCIADWDLKLGAVEAVYTDGSVRYPIVGVDASPNNSNFRVTDGVITLYRYNSATTWDTASEYEVEIYQ